MKPAQLWAWRAAVVLVFIGDLFLHLPVTHLFDGLAARLGFFPYDRLLLHISEGLGVAVLGVVAAWRKRPAVLVAGTAALLAATVAARRFMEVASIENIHYPQYALLTFLLARAGLGLEASWLGATALGVVDEGYQYLFLREGTFNYLDWNDIVFNAIGAGFGLVALLLLARRPEQPLCSWRTAATLAAVGVGTALIFAPPHWLPFYKVTPIGIHYHVFSASEGLATLSVFWFGCRLLLRRALPPAIAPPRA